MAQGPTFAFVWGSCAEADLATSSEADPADGVGWLEPHPNPAATTVTVSYEVYGAGPAKLAVYDLLGRHVRTLAGGLMAPGRQSVQLDVSGLPAGTYLVRLDTGGRSVTRSLAVAR